MKINKYLYLTILFFFISFFLPVKSDTMFDLGAIKEVRKFNLIKIKKLNSVNHVIGIKEINAYLTKKAELSDIKEQILIKTRQYAKRQSTWSRGHMTNWHKIDPKSKNPFKKILK